MLGVSEQHVPLGCDPIRSCYGDSSAWTDLGLRGDERDAALYVGKSEDSLMARDIDCNFGDGRTGSSTVRRSFAALLRERLSLAAIPRNPVKPGYFANYALAQHDDAKLTAWMRERLKVAVWTWHGEQPLADIERVVLQRLNPPLNIAGGATRPSSRSEGTAEGDGGSGSSVAAVKVFRRPVEDAEHDRWSVPVARLRASVTASPSGGSKLMNVVTQEPHCRAVTVVGGC